MIHPYDLIFSGMALDIVGAVILAKGFMFKNPEDAYRESQTMIGGNDPFLKSTLLQREEAGVGAFFLIAGLFLQICGNLHGGIAASEPGWINSPLRMIGVIFAVFIVGVCFLRLAKWQACATFSNIRSEAAKENRFLTPLKYNSLLIFLAVLGILIALACWSLF